MEYKATFSTPPVTVGASSVPETTEGHILTPFLKGTNQRVMLLLSDEDRGKFDNLPRDSRRQVAVTDLMVGSTFVIARADCGAGCRCAAEVVG